MSQVDQLKAQPMPVVLSYMLPKYNSLSSVETRHWLRWPFSYMIDV